ncbi:hypothetical protein BDN72DRAFT_957080 [Pluteus cervinus]|uniref:Uncharacterized protein n=1 Tax=Pluteus cervinus TaxID=181527 RepID=A0ACD3B415_9AGAR|nr:hypothetical protein BDN72DRAFT_957080 [Pluteus cervinus]
MATSRAESQHSQYGRRRSNTAQSILRTVQVPHLKVGDQKVLNSWVHDKETTQILFNHSWWPGAAEGDLIRVAGTTESSSSFLFTVPKEDAFAKPQLQISIPQPIADSCSLRNNGEVILTKVDKDNCSADYVEFIFQDQYLGRNDMWRLGEQLVGQCIHTNQEVTFIGSIAAKIHCIYIGGERVSSAYMTSTTKSIYRSLSAKVTIFIQVCHELWEFAGDGERYNEKIVHSFLPALFAKWREAGTNHTVSIVLISRVFYDESEIGYAAGPLRRDDLGNWYKDFFKVITDLEVIYDWKPTLVVLKESFWDFQRDILLTHHYHRAHQDAGVGPSDQVRLVGRLSNAQDGPLLESLNLALNPTEHHYIDRSLSLTGVASIVITPGTGFYRVSRQLLRLTTTRMLDQGFGLDLVSLAKPPLHQVPVFCFESPDKPGAPTGDPLWGPDDDSRSGKTKTYWWEPFWISMSFWDKQMDLPFREDRFVARAKMHQIQMLGLLEHDVLSSIEVPFLNPQNMHRDPTEEVRISKEEADQFDADVFSLTSADARPSNPHRQSLNSSTGSLLITTPHRPTEKRNTMSHRNSLMTGSRIAPIEESPRRSSIDLPSPTRAEVSPATTANGGLSTSPSRLSIRSVSSNLSDRSTSRGPRSQGPGRSSLASKLAPAWLFNPFRSNPSEPQTSQVSAQASPTGSAKVSLTAATPPSSSPIRMPTMAKPIVGQTQSPLPMAIKNTPGNRSHMSRTFEEETYVPGRTTQVRRSPINTPPFDESQLSKRWSVGTVNLPAANSSSSPSNVIDPSRPKLVVPAGQASLAKRWQHMFPKVMYKHDIKWTSMVTPGCLPLTVEYFPTTAELESSYDVFSYDFVVDPGEMRSFLVKPPNAKGTAEEVRRAWALVVMRGMAAVRLAQGFQFVLRPRAEGESDEEKSGFRRTKSFNPDDESTPKPAGPSEVLKSTTGPVYLSMSNEIHRISYTGEAIQVRRYVRRMPATPKFKYQCLIWPKLGGGYTEVATSFASHGLEDYGWNRLDMLVAGYEHHFNESLRYWRTRFIVIPTTEPPQINLGPSGEVLNDEEMRILGIEKLAEQFSKLRWLSPDDKAALAINGPPPPVRLLPTTLDPAASVMDESLLEQLDTIHAAGPLRKKMKSEKEIGELPLNYVAKAMREEGGVPIKYNQWHRSQYPNSFTGYDFVSWVVREFRDISSRAQGVECGAKLLDQGLFEHCRGQHGFLDGHYYYRFKGEYAVPMTPKSWFRRYTPGDDNLRAGHYPSGVARPKNASPRKVKKRCILSQSMVIDIDPNKKSDQAESVILHHDLIHNPSTVFHFELQWIGTTARGIEDLIRQWNRTVERYGLRLVEAYVTQISEVRTRNAFQSCFPLRLAVPPPIVPDLDKRVPEGTLTAKYFEYAILRKFGFIIDVEAVDLYPEQIDVVYSYRRSPFKYSQFVHRSGVAFVQVLGGTEGFLFLTNRLMGPGRLGTTTKRDHPAAAAADEIRVKLQQFCSDKAALEGFYDNEQALLSPPVAEEPPPLSI